jgi:hypothetical protein
MLRLDPEIIEAVKARGVPLTRVVEEGIAWWLAREKRKAPVPEQRRPRPAAAA